MHSTKILMGKQSKANNALAFLKLITIKTLQVSTLQVSFIGQHMMKCPVDTNVNYNSQKLTYYGLFWVRRWNGEKRIVIIYQNRTFSLHYFYIIVQKIGIYNFLVWVKNYSFRWSSEKAKAKGLETKQVLKKMNCFGFWVYIVVSLLFVLLVYRVVHFLETPFCAKSQQEGVQVPWQTEWQGEDEREWIELNQKARLFR